MCNALSWTTKSRSFSWQGETSLGLVSKVSAVTEMILSAPILRSWWHLGQAAICVAGELKLASATTFTGVPQLQHHNATSLAMLPPATIVACLIALRTNRKAYSVRYFGLKSVAVISD